MSEQKQDIHKQVCPDIGMFAGITNLKVTLKSPRWTLLIKAKIMVPLGETRGAHMSRLIIPHYIETDSVETFITLIKNQVLTSTKTYPYIHLEFQFPWRDQFANITIENYISIINTYTFEIKGITACPCSKEMMGIGHMQRCNLKIEVIGNWSFETILAKMDQCFSATLTEKLKRVDEANKIAEAQQNAKFVEDVCRTAYLSINSITEIVVTSEESIHSHEAIASWKKAN